MGKYQRTPINVDAVQWLGEENGPYDPEIEPLNSSNPELRGCGLCGGALVLPRTWVVTDSDGKVRHWTPTDFEATFEPVEKLIAGAPGPPDPPRPATRRDFA